MLGEASTRANMLESGEAIECAAAEAHARHSDRQPWPVGEPFDQGGDGRDVGDSQTDAAKEPLV
jgi:hypothetical protein